MNDACYTSLKIWNENDLTILDVCGTHLENITKLTIALKMP